MPDLSEKIENSLNVLFEINKQVSKKKFLLDKNKTVYLQIALFKIPKVGPPKRRFVRLPHSVYSDEPDICLFVPNRKTGVEYKKTTDDLIDFCVDNYTEFLEKHKVKGITTVMPLKQLQSEYGTYELRRKLVNRFDLFLCKNSLLYNPRFISSLGKIFIKANKFPLGISFPDPAADYDPSFNENIERAIHSSSFYIKSFSDNYTIPIGTLGMKKSELQDNLNSVLHQLFTKKMIPGNFENVKSIYLWPSQSKAIPVYFSMSLPTNLKTLRIRSSKPRVKAVEDEISTLPGRKVRVLPSGKVIVKKVNKLKSENEELEIDTDTSMDEGSEVEEEDDKVVKTNPKQTKTNKDEESESDGDDEIEEREQRLLRAKREAEEEESFIPKKKKKVVKKTSQDKTEDEPKEGKIKIKKKQKLTSVKKNLDSKKKGITPSVKSKKLKEKKTNKAAKKQLMKQKKFSINEKKRNKIKKKMVLKG